MSKIALGSIAELVQPSLRQCGVELVDASWGASGGDGLLRLVIDKEDGVTIDDCQRVSYAVTAVLDAYDPIAGNYRLEVSSPGAERPLRTPDEWERAIGRKVNVRFHTPVPARPGAAGPLASEGAPEMILEGRLLQAGIDAVEIEAMIGKGPRTRIITVPVADIAAARIVVDI